VEPEAFYDDLAPDYHLIFADWEASIARQAEALAPLLGAAETVLDAACGIGTQALGLARAGFAVTASDVSPAAVARCAREATARGLLIRTAVADLRTLDLGRFDAVVCMDNALPHLLTDEDLAAAWASLHRSLVPAGLLLASTRDYDAAPTGDPPRRFAHRTVEQIWEWEDDERYVLRHRIVRDGQVAERRTRYRALRRATLTAALQAAGFDDVAWPTTAFPQPVVSARTSSRATATSRTRR
jgi:glycine/sarcosine N-methyltransferase